MFDTSKIEECRKNIHCSGEGMADGSLGEMVEARIPDDKRYADTAFGGVVLVQAVRGGRSLSPSESLEVLCALSSVNVPWPHPGE